jgi:F0F1-type ATP synthase membrane subunit b/b'
VLIVLLLAIVVFYYFVLRPIQSTLLEATANIKDMAKAMENTSKSLEISNQVHQDLLKAQVQNP